MFLLVIFRVQVIVHKLSFILLPFMRTINQYAKFIPYAWNSSVNVNVNVNRTPGVTPVKQNLQGSKQRLASRHWHYPIHYIYSALPAVVTKHLMLSGSWSRTTFFLHPIRTRITEPNLM